MNANDYITIAKRYEGIKTGSTDHKNIVDHYNVHCVSKQRYGVKMSYEWAWCACFVSAVAHMSGFNNENFPMEISCYYMRKEAERMGIWTTDSKKVYPGCLIIYDWKDDGTCDHVGIIESVTSTQYKVIEGNLDNSVKTRYFNKTSREIEGFILLKYDKNNLKSVTELATEVILGYWGNGSQRKTLLESMGYNYNDVQKEVNQLISKVVPNKKDNTTIAREVIAGKWGNGKKRRAQLEKAGYNYNDVQKIVNELLS